jgi:isopenicillin-N epimerase
VGGFRGPAHRYARRVRPYGPDSPWRFEPGLVYLTHGTFGACPVPVLEAQRALIDELEASPVQVLYREFEPRLDAARREVAGFLGADPEGVVFVQNATTGVSTVLRSLRIRPGDELLTTDHEYNAVLIGVAVAAEDAKARVVTARVPLPIRHPEEVVEAVISAVTPRTRLAVVSHVTSPTGLVFPIETIVRELDRLGVDTLVDAAHAPGAVPVDVDALGAAYWTGNGHKWLCGPKVSGVLAVRSDRRAGIRPLVTSHGWNDEREDRHPLWRTFDWQGTIDPTAFLALPMAIRLVASLDPNGWPGLMAANRSMALVARSRLEELLGVEPLAPESMVGPMATVRVPWLESDDAAQALIREFYDRKRIEVPFFGWPVPAARERASDGPTLSLVRVSAQRYNEPADIDHLVDALAARRVGAQPSAIVGG